MKSFFALLAVLFFSNSALESATPRYELLIRIEPQEAQLTENGLIVDCGHYGKVNCSNIKFDEKGAFFPIEFAIHCSNCNKSLDHQTSFCQRCHTSSLHCLPKERTSDEERSRFEGNIIAESTPMILEELGQIAVGGGVDSEGNKSVEGSYEDETEDGSFSWSVKGEVTQDDEGEVEGEVKVEIKWEF